MLQGMSFRKIVIKIGTKVLTQKGNSLDAAQIKNLVNQIGAIVKRGTQVVMVSSGAIGSGMGLLKLKQRPKVLSELQACAAVGQPHLMQAYDDLFKANSILTAQVLLTQEDLTDRKRYLNAKATLLALLSDRVVPVVNENDTVSTDEIRFGDNDKLSSLVANLIEADLLILLSNVDGLYKYDASKKGRELVSIVDKISGEIESMARKGKDELGTGGMVSKLQAVKIATDSGIPCIIANGKKAGVLIDIMECKKTGTLFLPSSDKMAAKKRWLCFGAKSKGGIKVDDGAKEALTKRHKSLLSSGIIGASGDFKKNDIVSVVGADNKEFARGIVNYSSHDIDKIKGLKTAQITKAIGHKQKDEVIHKDNLVITEK